MFDQRFDPSHLPFDHHTFPSSTTANGSERQKNEGRGWSVVAKGMFFFPLFLILLLTTAEFRSQTTLLLSHDITAHDDSRQRDYNGASRVVPFSSSSFRPDEVVFSFLFNNINPPRPFLFFATRRGVVPSSSRLFFFSCRFSFAVLAIFCCLLPAQRGRMCRRRRFPEVVFEWFVCQLSPSPLLCDSPLATPKFIYPNIAQLRSSVTVGGATSHMRAHRCSIAQEVQHSRLTRQCIRHMSLSLLSREFIILAVYTFSNLIQPANEFGSWELFGKHVHSLLWVATIDDID